MSGRFAKFIAYATRARNTTLRKHQGGVQHTGIFTPRSTFTVISSFLIMFTNARTESPVSAGGALAAPAWSPTEVTNLQDKDRKRSQVQQCKCVRIPLIGGSDCTPYKALEAG